MMILPTFVTFCFALSGVEAVQRLGARQEEPTNPYATIAPSRSLVWHDCFAEIHANFFCALLDVPLDYAIPTGNRAYIPFIKYAATATPYKGVVLLNYGGPGEEGIPATLASAEYGSNNNIGHNLDIVSFDPRGIGYSTPSADCSASATSNTAPISRRFVNKLTGPRFSPKYFLDAYRNYTALGQQCQSTIGGDNAIGQHMHSTIVARDMISFLDAYANSTYSAGVVNAAQLNYWGFSYGTYIGQIFANKYPSRVGRVILDSVVDTTANLGGVDLNEKYADEAFSTFFVYCHLAGADKCAFYTGRTSNDIYLRFEKLVKQLPATLAQLENWSNATLIEQTLEAIKIYSAGSTYTPSIGAVTFTDLAYFLVDAEAFVMNLTTSGYNNLITAYDIGDNSPLEWAPAIQCTDNKNIWLGKPFASFLPINLASQLQSYIFGETTSNNQLQCAAWSIVGKGVYSGPFGGVKTANPILFISNTRDPVLALQNGQKATAKYPGSQLLIVDGTGHTSANLFNSCAFDKIGAFFQNGTLPGTDNFCPLSAQLPGLGPFGVSPPSPSSLKRDIGGIQSQLKALIDSK